MSEPPSATVADAAATPTADPRALSPGTSRLLWSTFLGLGLAAVIALIPLPYAVLRPGPATNTLGVDASGKPLIEVPDATTYPTTGSLDFTTVRVSGGPGRRVNAWDLLGAWLDPDDDIFREKLLFPEGSTSEQVQERNQEEMVNSQQEAAVVALRSLGKDVGRRFVVGSLADDAPARSVIKVGDAITAVDGRVVTSIEQIQLGITAHPPGESVDLTIERGGREQDVQAKTTEVDGSTVLGVRLRIDYDLPVEVIVRAGDVGGPSAGTMFALAIRDLLTPGSMTGGKAIAGTGTIDDAGAVGPIGGIRQKVVGAQAAGADFFLAPAANCPDVSGQAPEGLTIVRIATFDEAVAAVAKIADGSGGLPTCP